MNEIKDYAKVLAELKFKVIDRVALARIIMRSSQAFAFLCVLGPSARDKNFVLRFLLKKPAFKDNKIKMKVLRGFRESMAKNKKLLSKVN